MPAIGMGLAWAGYTGCLWAYCLIRGYDVTLGQLVNPVHVLNWKTATAQLTPNTQIVPGGQNAAAGASSSAPSVSAGPNAAAVNAGRTAIPGSVAGRL
jgi:hypothetical protein